MGIGYGAAYADVIDEKHVRKLCPKEYHELEEIIEEGGISLEDVAAFFVQDRELCFPAIEDDKKAVKLQDRLIAVWKRLQAKFRKKSGGLELDIGFHDSNNEGDRYDDVNGPFFCVGGMYKYSKAGLRFKKKVERKFFVCFG